MLENLKLLNNIKFGLITEIVGEKLSVANLSVSIGDIVSIVSSKTIKGVVTAINSDNFTVVPFSHVDGFSINDKVYKEIGGLSINVSDSLKGRVVNAFGEPIDDKGSLVHESPINVPLMKEPIPAMKREPIKNMFKTGVNIIDGILPTGCGQKVGIFAGSGVGKSTLLSMITKNSSSDVKVIALIGERGREVLEFIQQNLNNDLEGVVIVAATSDESPLTRKYAVLTALSISEYFRDKGEDVLLIVDSITRVAIAQREIGLLSGEMPALKGYTPSVFTLLPQVLERVANINGGTMTAFFTVLVDGDNLNEPIADQTRSILDGHIVLSRKLTETGVYPPVDVLKSASRVLDLILDENEIKEITKYRNILSTIVENETIVNIGAYQYGSNKKLDMALSKKESIFNFIKQSKNEKKDYNKLKEELRKIIS